MARMIDADKLLDDITAAEEHGGMGAVIAGTLRRYVMRQPTLTPPNEPLTLEQLREMNGEPVWVVLVDEKFSWLNGWYLVHHGSAYLARIDDWELDDDKYGVEWLAYRRPPEGEEAGNG